MLFFKLFLNRLLAVVLPLLLLIAGGSVIAGDDAADPTDRARQYLLGQGVKKDPDKAAKLYREAAAVGNAAGQDGYGVCLLHGFGVQKNEAAGVQYFRLSAEQGFAAACLNLAECLENGDGVARNEKEALRWAEKARELSSRQSTDTEVRNFKEAKKFIARLQVRVAKLDSGRITGTGTGFFITADGYLLTCAHVVAGATAVKVCLSPRTPQAQMLAATVVRVDQENDLVLLKVEGCFKPLPLTDVKEVKLAQEVFTIGFPNPQVQGMAPKFTQGSISSMSGIKDNACMFQISVPVQPGNSGGPLADARGNVIGVIKAQVDPAALSRAPQNVNYAIKINQANSLLQNVSGLSGKLPDGFKGGSSMTQAAERVQAATVLILQIKP